MINNERDLSEARRILRNDDIPVDQKNQIQAVIYQYLKKQKQKRIDALEEKYNATN